MGRFTTAPNINTDSPENFNEPDALVYGILAVLGVCCFFTPVFYCILKEMNCRISEIFGNFYDKYIYNYCCCYLDYYNYREEPHLGVYFIEIVFIMMSFGINIDVDAFIKTKI